MAKHPYRRSARSRLTALIFTDRIGQTLAATLGLSAILRWWISSWVNARRQATR